MVPPDRSWRLQAYAAIPVRLWPAQSLDPFAVVYHPHKDGNPKLQAKSIAHDHTIVESAAARSRARSWVADAGAVANPRVGISSNPTGIGIASL